MQTLTQLPRTTLYYSEGASDKVYQCEIKASGLGFVVNFAYGRRGATLNTGTKTNDPVELEEAQAIYEKLIKEKKGKGYTEGEGGVPYTSLTSTKPTSGLLPQLLNPIEEKFTDILIHDENWCLQEKLDGRRLLIQKRGETITGINKKGLIIGLALPVFAAMRLFKGDVVLDDESIGETFHCFDILNLNGQDISGWSCRQRQVSLMNLLFSVQQRAIKLVETHYTTIDKTRAFEQLKAAKREGVVLKRLDAPYKPGRPSSGGTQLKHKFVATLSALVSVINKQRSIGISLLGKNGWQVAGNVTIPTNHSIPRQGKVVEIRYLYAFPESDVLFQPVYLGARTDVDALECRVSQLKYKSEEEEP